MRRLIAAVVLAGALIPGAVAAQAADRDDVSTTVRINQLTASLVTGKVFSKEKECIAERPVFLFRLVGGGQPKERVATAKTSKTGSFVIHTALASGEYLAIAPNHREGDINCRFDTSPIRSL